jgi:hypothetical protein
MYEPFVQRNNALDRRHGAPHIDHVALQQDAVLAPEAMRNQRKGFSYGTEGKSGQR